MSQPMSRYDRLERWAIVLECAPATTLTPFQDVEFLPVSARAGLQAPNSPLAIAYADPVLRRAGLDSDRFGDGSAFFDLTRYQAHRVLCSCGYIGTMQSSEVARRIRAIAMREKLRERWRGRWPANPLPALARWLAARWEPLAGQRG
jgi:hypothetical protein